jgi:uncharacterized integral membrane protein
MDGSQSKPARTRREQTRAIVPAVLVALVAVFAVLNLDEVEVNWIIGTWSTPLIIVIAVSVLVGAAVGWVAARRRGR